jgi:phosphoribosyl isomerase A
VFEVIPAIDASEGRLVRMEQGTVVPVEAFDGDPLRAARFFVEAGATRLHVVDVDLALTGVLAAADLLRAIADLGVPIQASGGIGSDRHVSAALEAGASRVVVGSVALIDRSGTEGLLARHGDAVAVGIEERGGTIRPRGRPDHELPIEPILAWLHELPVARYVHTAVGRAGELRGPDVDGVRALVARSGRPVLAAGGIRDGRDLYRLAETGAEGAIVGRALFEGLDLRAAMAAVG